MACLLGAFEGSNENSFRTFLKTAVMAMGSG
jgi:hypothetical protein